MPLASRNGILTHFLIGKNCVSKVFHYIQALIDPIEQIAHISRRFLVHSHSHEASHPILKKKHLGSKRRERFSGWSISFDRRILHRRERIRRARGCVNSTKLPVAAQTGGDAISLWQSGLARSTIPPW
jgi:hypothetical protein